MSRPLAASQRRYYRLSGGGNDFLALVDETVDEAVDEAAAPAAAEIRALCRRGLSLGADGLFTLRRTSSGARMDYHNADGAPAPLCLNGTRCAARLVFELGWAVDRCDILTGAGTVSARRAARDTVEVELEAPPEAPRPAVLTSRGQSWSGWRVAVGVPHFVLLWPDSLAVAPVAELGRRLRAARELSPEGANVDFVRFPDPFRAELRTWERGVEAETLACGTGALAAAAVGLATGAAKLPLEILTLGGCVLTVAGEVEGGRPRRWSLAGDARLVASGEITAAAFSLPDSPRWSS